MKQNLLALKNGDTFNTDDRATLIHHVGTPNWPQTGALTQVGPKGQNVAIFKSKRTGEHYAKVDGYSIPKDICGLAAGKDAWMRNILFRCSECKVRMPVGDMDCGLCDKCAQVSYDEIAELDSAKAFNPVLHSDNLK